MPTARAVTASIAPRIASPVGGLRSSVSSSIKSSPIKMISIGPEGGRARIDTSFSPNPFTRMRPINPDANPGRKIFGENGSVRPKTAESVFGPKLGEIRFNRPAPRVGYTPEAAAKADIGTTFAKARARNQAQVAALEAENRQIATAFIASALPDVRRPNPNQAIDFKGSRSTSKAKEPAQEASNRGSEKTRFPNAPHNPNSETISRPSVEARPIFEPAKFAYLLRNWKSLPTDAIFTNRLVSAIGVSENRKPKTENGLRIGQRVASPELTPVYQPTVEPLPILTREKVASFSALKPLVERGIVSEDQAMQAAGVISAPRVETPRATPEAPKITLPKVAGITPKQAERLIAMAPIIQEGNPAIKDQIYLTLGIKPEIGQNILRLLPISDSRAKYASEASPLPQERPELGQAMRLIKTLDIDFKTEDEAEVRKKAQALIAVIGQTYQLNALGNTEADTALLVERQLAASEAVPQRLRARVSSLLVRMVREVSTEPTEDPNKKALHQVDLEKQNKRVKLAAKSIDNAPRNDQGEIARDYVISQIQENNNSSHWGRLAIILKQNFDGSLDEIVVRLKKLKFWESAQTVAQTIDKSMDEFPAVEPAFKQTTKEVGRKEVGKTMDPMWAEMIKSLIRTLVVNPEIRTFARV